jgi:NADPH2:quinone reductase
MKALLSREAGPPESLILADVPDAEPRNGEVLIRVVACAANCPDLLMIQDRYQVRPPRPFIPGAEVAGIVERVGEGVSSLATGERVMAVCNWGGMAELVAVPASRCIPVPSTVPLEEAAALQLTYGTAYFGLRRCAHLEPADQLLVLGAAGGVGLAAVEIGKALGAQVIAAVSSEAKATIARSAGAEQTLLYPRGPFTDPDARKALATLFKQVSRPSDVILDPVGGDYAEAALRSIAWGGRYVVVGFASGIPKIPLNVLLMKGAQIVSAPWGGVVERDPAAFRETMDALLDLHALGAIRPRISLRLPLDRASEAFARFQERAAIGKILILPGD